MAEQRFFAELAEALGNQPSAAPSVNFDRTMSRNTAAAMTACLTHRLQQSDRQLRRVRNTTYAWNGGILNLRNAVNEEMWTNLRTVVADDLHRQASKQPVAFVMTRWSPTDVSLDVWLIPEAVIHAVLPKLPVEQTPGKKTVRIKPTQQRFEGLADSPSVAKFHMPIRLLSGELSLLAAADEIDNMVRKGRKQATPLADNETVEQVSTEGTTEVTSGFWWVNQGQNYAAERRLGVVWSPQRTDKGKALFHWTNVSRIRAGDVVFHYAGGALRSVSVARADGHAGQQPPELSGTDWGRDGWTVELDYHDFSTPIPLAAVATELGRLSIKRGPLNSIGGVNQSYLFELPAEAAHVIAAQADLSSLPDGLVAKIRNKTAGEDAVSSPVLHPVYTVDQATAGLFVPAADVVLLLDDWRRKKNLILQGPPGVGKTFIARRLAYALMGRADSSRIEMVQFHQSYAYEDFVQGWRPQEAGGFRRRNGVFVEFCRRAATAAVDQPHVFVIDEINRGNLSRIFGELMYLLEPDHRGPEHAIPLTYSESADDRFFVPSNVFVLGMMNTADRSLAMVDYALRRRFVFTQLRPAFATTAFRTFLAARGASETLIGNIVERMSGLNERIRDDKNLGRGFEIGHSFFCPVNGETLDDAWYASVINREVAPLMREYWFDDLEQAEELIDGLR